MNPSKEQAFQFATMLRAGLPAEQAIVYFLSPEQQTDPLLVGLTLQKWTSSPLVAAESARLEGKEWTSMTQDEMLNAAIGQHYRSLAWFLYSNNYTSANQVEKSKLDSARSAVESKLAGTAGKLNALDQFYQDIKSGVLKFPQKSAV